MTDGDLLLTDDLALSVCGWTRDERARRRLAQRLRRERRIVGARRWVWLHHVPVAGSPTAWDGRRDCGEPEIRRLVDELQPDIVVSGHAHEAPFARGGDWQGRLGRTLLLNPGQVPGSRPASITIDLDAALATWHSSIGDASIRETTQVTPQTGARRRASIPTAVT